MVGRQGYFAYVKAAFLEKWHLLFFGAGALAGAISGHADVALPALFALELLYLTGLSTSARFQLHVDRTQGQARFHKDQAEVQQRYNWLFYGLSYPNQQRFEELRGRCEVLRELMIRDSSSRGGLDAAAIAQLDGVNKLLWVYLKLLHTRQNLSGFLQSTNAAELHRKLEELEARLAEIPEATPDPLQQKKRKTLQDTRETIAARRDNLQRAKEREEFMSLELERIGAKLAGIAEVAMNRQDPEALTHDVDDVARSVEATEVAIGELQSFTGLTEADAVAPPILGGQALKPKQ